MTEAELFGVDNATTFVMWTQYFFQEQAKLLPNTSKLKNLGNNNVIEHHSISEIHLKQNGKWSSRKCTRHINIRYFYVTDKIQNDYWSMIYKPSHEMVSDFLTNPLQGKPFAKHLDIFLGLEKGDYTTFYTKYNKIKNGV